MDSRDLFASVNHNEVFICPISLDEIQHPVINPQGTTYEQEEIKKWLLQKPNDPLDRHPLKKSDLIPNHLFSIIKKLRDNPTTNLFDLRSLLTCPLTGKLFSEPVVTYDGFTYEKSAIVNFIKNTPEMACLPLYPNRFIKTLIEDACIFNLISDIRPDYFLFNSYIKDLRKYLTIRAKEPYTTLNLPILSWLFEFNKSEKFTEATNLLRRLSYHENSLFSPNKFGRASRQGRLGKIAKPALERLSLKPTASV